MKESLLNYVRVEKLDVLHDALLDVIQEMQDKSQRDSRFSDDVYSTLVFMSYRVFGAIKTQVSKRVETGTSNNK